MEIIRNILCSASFIIFAGACFFCTKKMYPEISARIVLVLVSPFLFGILGALLGAFIGGIVTIPFAIVLRPVLETEANYQDLRMGISFMSAALFLSYCLYWYSERADKRTEDSDLQQSAGDNSRS